MNVGIALTPCDAAVSWHLSTSTFKNIARGYLLGNCSNCGAIRWQGPHLHNKQKIDWIKWRKRPEILRKDGKISIFDLPSCCKIDDHQTNASGCKLSLKMVFIFDCTYAHFRIFLFIVFCSFYSAQKTIKCTSKIVWFLFLWFSLK